MITAVVSYDGFLRFPVCRSLSTVVPFSLSSRWWEWVGQCSQGAVRKAGDLAMRHSVPPGCRQSLGVLTVGTTVGLNGEVGRSIQGDTDEYRRGNGDSLNELPCPFWG